MDIIGYMAAVFTAGTMLPQIIKSIRTKHVRDISIHMLLMYIINASLWITYALTIGATPLLFADFFALCAGLTQLALKLKYNNFNLESAELITENA